MGKNEKKNEKKNKGGGSSKKPVIARRNTRRANVSRSVCNAVRRERRKNPFYVAANELRALAARRRTLVYVLEEDTERRVGTDRLSRERFTRVRLEPTYQRERSIA